MLRWKRTIRTKCSERFVAVRDEHEVGTADVHFLNDGAVVATVTLFKSAGWTEEQIPDLLANLDEDLLPTVDAAEENFRCTVIIGDIVSDSNRT